MIWPKNGRAAATASNQNIAVYMDKPDVHVMMHETGHILDGQHKIHVSPGWEKALAKDSCVPTDYARTSGAEAVGELVPMVMYSILDKQGFDAYGTKYGNFKCMQNQFNYVKSILEKQLNVGGMCPERWSEAMPSKPIWVRKRGWEEKLTPRDAEPEVFDADSLHHLARRAPMSTVDSLQRRWAEPDDDDEEEYDSHGLEEGEFVKRAAKPEEDGEEYDAHGLEEGEFVKREVEDEDELEFEGADHDDDDETDLDDDNETDLDDDNETDLDDDNETDHSEDNETDLDDDNETDHDEDNETDHDEDNGTGNSTSALHHDKDDERLLRRSAEPDHPNHHNHASHDHEGTRDHHDDV